MTRDIIIHNLNKTFNGQGRVRQALKQVSLTVEHGEMVALIGVSGSGKSTLLRHLNGLCAGADGMIQVGSRVVQQKGRINKNINDVRAEIGMISQQFNLVGRLSVITNVLVGMLHHLPWYRANLGIFTRQEKLNAIEALERVGLGDCAFQRASTLSGGQQQRVAIARALVQRAKIILGDEPIASLDPESSRNVMDILQRINREDRTTVIVSLHQVGFALQYCPRTIALRAGEVVYDGPSACLTNARLREIYGSQMDLLEVGSVPAATTAPSIDPMQSRFTAPEMEAMAV
jgi:phosphonate transport system ATP-binding protein